MKKILYSIFPLAVLALVFTFVFSVYAKGKDKDDDKIKGPTKAIEKAIERLEKFSDADFGISEKEAAFGNTSETLSIGKKGHVRITAGKVTATASSTITVSVWKMSFTVHNMPDNVVNTRGHGRATFESIKVGDVVDVRGVLDENTALFIHAKHILNRSANLNQREEQINRMREQIRQLIERLNKLLQGGTAPPPSSSDTAAPTMPGGFVAQAVSSSQINLAWGVSTDNIGVTAYKISRCTGAGCSIGDPIATVTSTSYQDTSLSASTTYVYTIAAYDAAGNGSIKANTSATTQSASTADTSAPTKPTSVSAGVAATSNTQINLGWLASTDNVGVTGYKIFRCSGASCSPESQITTISTASYSDTGLTASTTYGYSVAAYDAAGNVSEKSSVATATTP